MYLHFRGDIFSKLLQVSLCRQSRVWCLQLLTNPATNNMFKRRNRRLHVSFHSCPASLVGIRRPRKAYHDVHQLTGRLRHIRCAPNLFRDTATMIHNSIRHGDIRYDDLYQISRRDRMYRRCRVHGSYPTSWWRGRQALCPST